jgi:hypothetical protein
MHFVISLQEIFFSAFCYHSCECDFFIPGFVCCLIFVHQSGNSFSKVALSFDLRLCRINLHLFLLLATYRTRFKFQRQFRFQEQSGRSAKLSDLLFLPEETHALQAEPVLFSLILFFSELFMIEVAKKLIKFWYILILHQTFNFYERSMIKLNKKN